MKNDVDDGNENELSCLDGTCDIAKSYVKMLIERNEYLKDVLKVVYNDPEYCFLHDKTKTEIEFVLQIKNRNN